MAQVALRVAGTVFGAAIGSVVPGVGTALGAQIGGALGSFAGSFFAPDLPDQVGPRLDDLNVSSAAYGRPVPYMNGKMKIAATVDWSPGLKEHRHEEEIGGGSGGPSQTSVSFTYTASFGATICEGPVDAVLKIWRDAELIYDAENVGPQTATRFHGGISLSGGIRFYLGTETQEPDPAETGRQGHREHAGLPGNLPYRV